MLSGAITMPESFSTTLTTLVNNLTTSITNFVPTVLLAALPIVAVIAFFGYVWAKSRKAVKVK